MTRALVYGLAVAGAATVRALQRHDIEVVVADDEVTAERRQLARSSTCKSSSGRPVRNSTGWSDRVIW